MRLRALDRCYTSSTLIGGEGGASPRSLHVSLQANILSLVVHDYVCIYCFWGDGDGGTLGVELPHT